ncbi:MAG: SDR family oxidoreductase [Methanomassiliicoccaceae archaeon]|nr:SDR family oxidoreductase [Methanomassiliicoccaceae archaeon]
MNKVALITGTTSGIGYSMCERFAKEKIDLILVSRDHEKLRKQKERLEREHNVNVWTIAHDLAEPDAAVSVHEKVCEFGVFVDLLVHNAGFDRAGRFAVTDIEKEKEMIHLHTVFVTELTKLLLPSMISRKDGKILFIGSTASLIPCALSAVYSATKSYILFFSLALRTELKGTGVTSTVLCPGATRTRFAENADLEGTPLFTKHVMSPEKVADAGYRSMMKGKAKHVPGMYNKLLVLSSKILPSSVVQRSAVKMFTKKE